MARKQEAMRAAFPKDGSQRDERTFRKAVAALRRWADAGQLGSTGGESTARYT